VFLRDGDLVKELGFGWRQVEVGSEKWEKVVLEGGGRSLCMLAKFDGEGASG
jgi:hypothetical protein